MKVPAFKLWVSFSFGFWVGLSFGCLLCTCILMHGFDGGVLTWVLCV